VKTPTFLIRSSAASAGLLTSVRRAVERVSPDIAILSTGSIGDDIAELTAMDRATAQIALVFGCVALVLAAVGIYGVLSYGVSRRVGEIAIRMALGARQSQVAAMILSETLGLILIGVALGGGLIYATFRLIASQLYGVAPNDPFTLVAATILMALTALIAAYLPARRASRLDPTQALRQS
jgi:ABC-type antimicrobial peptide transport system permease subunit